MAQATRLLTAEEFEMLPDDRAGRRYELVRGEVVEVSGTGGEHGDFVGVIVALLRAFILPQRLGKVYGDNVGFIIRRDPDTVRIPDASFVSRARVPASGSPKGHWPLAPDLAVEVVSPGDRRREVEDKAEEYLAAGVRLVWVVWPTTRTVTMYMPDAEPRTLTADDTLDGGDVLPGFAAAVAELFDTDL